MDNATTVNGIFDVSQVGGNASEDIKAILGDPKRFFNSFLKPGQRELNAFGKAIQDRMVVTELSILKKAEEPNKLEGRAVLEIDVTEGTSVNIHLKYTNV